MIALLAVAVHLLLWYQHRDSPFDQALISDALSYDTWSARIAAEGLSAEPAFHQAPLYPVFLALLRGEAGHGSAIFIQVLLAGMAIALLVPIGRQYLGSERAGVAAALIALLHGPLALHQIKLLPVALPLAGLSLSIYLLGRCREQPGPLPAALCGAAFGVTALARAEVQLLVPVALLALGPRLWSGRRPDPGWLRNAAGFGAAFLIVIAPVLIHNASRGAGLRIALSAGENLYIGNQPGADGSHKALHPQAGDIFSQRELATRLAEESAGAPLTPGQVDRYWRGRAVEAITADPGAWIALESRKLRRVLDPGDPADMYSFALERERYLPLLYLLALPPWGLLLPGLIGGILAWPERRKAWPLIGFAAALLAVLLLFFVTTRLRLPFYFLLAPFAGFAVDRALLGWSDPRRRTGVIVAALLVAAGCAFSFVRSSEVPVRERVRLAATLSSLDRLDEGLDVLEPALEGEPAHAVALDQAGWLRQKRGDLAQASGLYRRALETGMPEGREASTRSRLAETLERQGAVDQALREHDAAVAAPGANAGTLFARGMFHLRQRRQTAAIADLEQAARLDPAWPAPREALRRLGR
ncbi:hypothetical protein ABI59_01990 [Acidobacteria bacterium Mor1]|nr:hypothetical protein ABI59_01990 [Acidobacteria bacterium Mor1]